jgi:hypothetical protein
MDDRAAQLPRAVDAEHRIGVVPIQWPVSARTSRHASARYETASLFCAWLGANPAARSVVRFGQYGFSENIFQYLVNTVRFR